MNIPNKYKVVKISDIVKEMISLAKSGFYPKIKIDECVINVRKMKGGD